MKKRFLNLLLVMVMVICVLPMTAFAESQKECTHKNDRGRWTVKEQDAKAATCTEDGNEAYFQCTQCERILEQKWFMWYDYYEATPDNSIPVIKAHHTDVIEVDKEDATCTEPGREAGTWCNACNSIVTGMEEIPADHNTVTVDEVPATCTTPGTTAGTRCTRCGASTGMEEIPAGHKWVDGKCTAEGCNEVCGKHTYDFENKVYKENHEATCEHGGLWLLTCTNCGFQTTQSADKVDHKEKTLSAVAPTCTTPGKTEGVECEFCHKVIVAQTSIPATGHSFDFENKTYKEGFEPTCEADGLYVIACKACDHKTTQTASALGHTYSIDLGYKEGNEPTCQATGLKVLECETCGHRTTQTAPKLNCNVEVLMAKVATCTESGLTAGTRCTVCGNGETCAYCAETLIPQETVDALGHDMQVVNEHTAPTCVFVGFGEYKCSRCPENYCYFIPAKGHDRKETVVTEVTCTTDGRMYVECQRPECGRYWTETIEAKGHTPVTLEKVDATCTETGLTEGSQCTTCNEILVAQTVIAKLRHSWKDVEAKAATCVADGHNAHRECENCGETDGKKVIPANASNHKFNAATHKCDNCDTYDHVHQETATVTTAATCEQPGVKTYSCSICNFQRTEPIAKTGHHYSNDHVCAGCGQIDPDSICYHTNHHTEKASATCTTDGYTKEVCDKCGATVGEVTVHTKTGHKYMNGVCSTCGARDTSKTTIDFQGVHIVGGSAY